MTDRWAEEARKLRDEIGTSYWGSENHGINLPWDGDWLGDVERALAAAYAKGREEQREEDASVCEGLAGDSCWNGHMRNAWLKAAAAIRAGQEGGGG